MTLFIPLSLQKRSHPCSPVGLPLRGIKLSRFYCLLLLLLFFACSRNPSPEQQQAWNDEIQRLQAEHDSLRARFVVLAEENPRIKALPEGDLIIAVPTAFLHSVIERVFTDVARTVYLSLSGIKAHVAKPVKKVITVGEFVLDIEITELFGRLKPGVPEVTFGADRVSLSLPVEVVEGHGEALLHFVWDGKNIAGLVCGDLDVTQKVSGDVIPARYLLSGSLSLAIAGKRVVGVPAFPETKLNIRVNPSPESWDAVNAILAEKQGVCGWVLEKVNVPHLLSNLLQEKGIKIKMPLDKIKPFALPAGVRDSVIIGDKTLALEAQTHTLRIDSEAVCYSADVALRDTAQTDSVEISSEVR